MSVYSEHAAGLRDVQSELGPDCPAMWFRDAEIRILPGGVRRQKDNTTGGFSLDSDIQLTCLLADFGGTPPESRDTFNYPGQVGRLYRIVSVTTAAGGLQVRINANDSAQKL